MLLFLYDLGIGSSGRGVCAKWWTIHLLIVDCKFPNNVLMSSEVATIASCAES
jgi:hypothetical protein